MLKHAIQPLINKTLITFKFLLTLIYFAFSPAYACSDILLVSNNSHFAIVHRIEAVLYAQEGMNGKLKHIILENTHQDDLATVANSSCLVVSIGAESLSLLLKSQVSKPIVSILVRKNYVQTALNQYHRSFKDTQKPITAIYLDQPIERQLKLVKAIFNQQDHYKIGILLGPNSFEEESTLERLSKLHHLDLHSIYVNKLENPVAVLDSLLNDTQIVLAIPDSQIYNPKTSRGILLTAFHKRVPLVAFSRTYVNNGALCAVYSSTKHFADQTAKLIIHYIQENTLPPPQYPEMFSVAVNYQVAQSLGLKIDSEPQLTQTLYRMETMPKADGFLARRQANKSPGAYALIRDSGKSAQATTPKSHMGSA